MTSASTSAFAPGRILQRRYRLDAFVTSSTLVEVWNGHDVILQRPVTVKLLHPGLADDQELVERFRQEAVDAARLSHPNIIPTYDTGSDDGAIFVVLGLVHGATLAEVLEQGPMATDQALLIARQIAAALDHVHRLGRAHGSLQPDTVLLLGADRRVLVTDFGLSAVAAIDETVQAYRAPELADHEADARSDVFSAGVVLRTMMTGRADGAVQDPAVAALLGEATELNPQARMPSAAALVDALDRVLREQSPTPRRVSLSTPRAPRVPQAAPSAAEEATAPHSVLDTGEYQPTRVTPAIAVPRAAPSYAPAPVPQHSSRGLQRLKHVSLALAALVILLALGVGIAINRLGSSTTAKGSTTTSAAPVALQASTFDPPPGDGSENDSTAHNAVDGNAATAWSTQTYANRTFGNLKSGVGLVVQLPNAETMRTLHVAATGDGWAAQIYVANSSATTLSGWGSPVDTQSGLSGTATFDLHGKSGSYVLLWITDLGSANRLAVNEMSISQ